MKSAWREWTEAIAARLSEQLGITVASTDLVVPPDTSLGDLAFGCFKLAKEKKISPAELAKNVAAGFSVEKLPVASVSAAGPYVNFILKTSEVVRSVVAEVEASREHVGACDLGHGQTLLFEHAQPNTHKEIHVGHLRLLVLGAALDRLLSHANWRVIPLSYHGDVGAHVAKCLWRLVARPGLSVRTLNEAEVERILQAVPSTQRNAKFLGEAYSESTRELEAHPEYKEDVSFVQQKLEAHDPVWEKLWLATRAWSLEEMRKIFEEIGARVERAYLESEVVERGQQMVDDLIARGVAKESQGAIVVDLEDVKLGVFLIRKSDGTSLYSTKDLALAELKLKEYPKASRSLILVDNRQAFYVKQLFETLRRLKIVPVPEFVGFEFVTLKTGAMSSREGNVVTLTSFRDEVVNYARQEIVARHADWSKKKIEEVTGAIAQAGMKFGMLKQDSDKIFVFDMEQALSFDGATGPYCQYAVTRLASILRKAQTPPPSSNSDAPLIRGGETENHPSEKALALVLAQFSLRVEQAARELRPSIVANWCVEAAQAVNAFYRDVPVLTSTGATLAGRLKLVQAARTVLSMGLELLGIPTPGEM